VGEGRKESVISEYYRSTLYYEIYQKLFKRKGEERWQLRRRENLVKVHYMYVVNIIMNPFVQLI
jgi:hypothetical protein